MKKWMSFGLLLASALPFLFSCQKEGSFETGNEPPVNDTTGSDPLPQGNDSTYLKMYIYLETALPPGQDTILKYIINYDSRKRVSYVEQYEYDEGFPGEVLYSDQKFFYHGTDTLPYKTTTYTWDTPGNFHYDTTFLTYENAMIVKDSSVTWSTGRTFPLSIVTNEFIKVEPSKYRIIYKKHDLFTFVVSSVDTVYSNRIWQGGNLVTVKDSFSRSPRYYDHTYNQSRQYDNNPSPFKFSLPYPAIVEYW